MTRFMKILSALLASALICFGASLACDDDDDDNAVADDDTAVADDDTAAADDDDDDTDDDDDDTDVDDDTPLPEGPGGFDPAYRSSPDFFTMTDDLIVGQEGLAVRIWYSRNILSLVDLDAFSVPRGTTAIQEVDQDGEGTFDIITVMVKLDEAYDPLNNDWYYETRTPDGSLRALPPPGRIQNCIDCHRDFAATDFLGGTKLRSSRKSSFR